MQAMAAMPAMAPLVTVATAAMPAMAPQLAPATVVTAANPAATQHPLKPAMVATAAAIAATAAAIAATAARHPAMEPHLAPATAAEATAAASQATAPHPATEATVLKAAMVAVPAMEPHLSPAMAAKANLLKEAMAMAAGELSWQALELREQADSSKLHPVFLVSEVPKTCLIDETQVKKCALNSSSLRKINFQKYQTNFPFLYIYLTIIYIKISCKFLAQRTLTSFSINYFKSGQDY